MYIAKNKADTLTIKSGKKGPVTRNAGINITK